MATEAKRDIHDFWCGKIVKKLRSLGYAVERSPSRCRDLIITDSGANIAVRVASIGKHSRVMETSKGKKKRYEYDGWMFNFHVHGKPVSGIDFFICVQVGDKHDVCWVIPASAIKSVTWSLLKSRGEYSGRYKQFREAWELLWVAGKGNEGRTDKPCE